MLTLETRREGRTEQLDGRVILGFGATNFMIILSILFIYYSPLDNYQFNNLRIKETQLIN